VNIDARIETLVRHGLDRAVRRDERGFADALRALVGTAPRRAAVELLVAVCAHVLLDLHSGHPPDGQQLEALGKQLERWEAWAQLTAEQATTFLYCVLGDPDATVEQDVGVLHAFAVTAGLLAGRPMPAGKWWYDYLDYVEVVLEGKL
jgi:hypothetical protein